MAQYTSYANYVIYFTDVAEYNFAVGIVGGPTIEISPLGAAGLFGFVDGVHYNTGGALHPVKGMYTVSYSLSSPGSQISHPAPSGVFLDYGVDSVLVPGQVTIGPGSGPDLLLKWSGNIVMVGAPGGVENPDNAPIPRRRWICGFEYDSGAEGLGSGSNNRDRSASRTSDGIGWGLRWPNNTNTTQTLTQYDTIGNQKISWERFYIRPSVIGSTFFDFWRSSGNISGSAGIRIRFLTDLSLEIHNVTAFSVFTLKATVPGSVFTLGKFHKIDLIVQYSSGSNDANFRLWVNGTQVAGFAVSDAEGGIGQNQNHASSLLGTQLAGITTWEIDFDDWHNAEVPNILGVESLTSIDWFLGTHMRGLKNNSGTSVNWTGQLQSTNQLINPENALTTSLLISTTALATIVALTEWSIDQLAVGTVFSTNAFLSMSYTQLASGTAAGRLGMRLGAGASIFPNTISESTAGRFNSALYPGSGVDVIVDPTVVSSFSVVYEKANNAVNTTVRALQGEVELIGIFGEEDSPDGTPLNAFPLITHNATYPALINAFTGPSADAPVCAVGGTYVGNGTTQTIALPLPCHFLWIRSTTILNAGTKWYGANLGGTNGASGAVVADLPVRVDYDPLTGISSFTVVGTNPNSNQAAATYQYIAFCDPGFSFCLCTTFHHATSLASFDNPLFDPTFNPAAAFVQTQRLNNLSTAQLYYIGQGFIGGTMKDMSGTVIATGGALIGPGAFRSQTNIHNKAVDFQVTACLFRTTDNCAQQMIQMYQYTGDGTSSQVVNAPTASGRFPLMVLVLPGNSGQAIVRDPSDAGVNSRTVNNNGVLTTGITAVGADTITVGSTLNASGVTYDVFIILGDSAGMNNGTFFASNCNSDEIVNPPEPPLPGIAVLTEGGLIVGGPDNPLSLLLNVSGIYTIVPGKRNDTLYDRQAGQPSIDVAIPNPKWGTGFIGG